MKDIVQQTKQKKKPAIIVTALLLIILIAVIGSLKSGGQEEYAYRETQVQYGTLVIGVTESGAVDIGTVEQTFDLDMSALQRVKTGNSNSGNSIGAGLNGIGASGGGFRVASGDAGGASSLTVSRVAVTVGERVDEG